MPYIYWLVVLATFVTFIKAYYATPDRSMIKVRWLCASMFSWLAAMVVEIFFKAEPSMLAIVLTGVNAVLAAVAINLQLKLIEYDEMTKRAREWAEKVARGAPPKKFKE